MERASGMKLSKNLIGASMNEGVLHIRFRHPKGRETDVEALAGKEVLIP